MEEAKRCRLRSILFLTAAVFLLFLLSLKLAAALVQNGVRAQALERDIVRGTHQSLFAASAFIHGNESCKQLSSAHSSWSLRLCWTLLVSNSVPFVSGFLIVSPAEGATCDELNDVKISLDRETEAFIRSKIGPHEFFFLVEGRETFWAPQSYEGHCNYRFFFHFVNPASAFRLHLVQLRSNFAANNELIPEFPPVNMTIIVDSRVESPWSHQLNATQDVCIRVPGGRFVYLGNDTNEMLRREPAFSVGLLPVPLLIDMRLRSSVQWQPYDCRGYPPSPAQLQLHAPPPAKTFNVQCAGQKIDFFGDSHMRVVFNHLLLDKCGVERAAQKGITASQCHGFGSMPLCPDVSVCMLFDPTGDASPTSDGHGLKRTALVLNFANHPASGLHWPLTRYVSRVKEVLQTFATGNLIWLGTVPIPILNSTSIWLAKDWRTFTRLAAMESKVNEIAEPFIDSGLMTFIDIFPLASAATNWSPDGAHLIGLGPPLDGIVATLLQTLCKMK